MTGPYTRRNTGRAPTNDSGTPVPIFVVSCAPTPAPASAPDPPRRYKDKDLQRVTKLALKIFVKGQEYGQFQANFAFCKQPLKTRFSDLYHKNSHLDC